jgi:hypothetical protein
VSGTLRCGCWWDVVGDGFVFNPCHLGCPAWAEVRDGITVSGKPLRVVMDPALGDVPLVYRCPACGKVQDAQTALDGSAAVPAAGDLGVCFDCGELFEFTAEGPRSLGAVEAMRVLASHPDVARAVAAIRARAGGAR